ncbi:MAG: hypothetical protein NTV51_20125 [Verrucomicrobia bacterium]|nr:hypothetical protein [Verrucomicrobiota bacterium]
MSLRFPLKRPAPAPVIATPPPAVTAVAGTGTTFSPVVDGSGVTYVWQKDGTTIAGATSATLTLSSVTFTDAGAYTVTVTNSGGSVTSTPAVLTVVAPAVAPTISASAGPANATVVAGAKSVLSVTPAGSAPFAYQWLRNGVALAGATSATLTLDTTLVTDAGAYSVTVSNSAGSVTSPAATLAVTPISRISNLSVLTALSAPGENFTLGYVVGGASSSAPKPLVVRSVGPALGALGVAGVLDDPRLELFTGSGKTSDNDNWAGTTALASAFVAVGAFPFASPSSKDAAALANPTTRDNSVKISSANDGAGLVLAEIYDATASDRFIATTPRLVNVSVRKDVGTGLTLGFTIAGATPKTVLIRAIGPTLADFGVPGTVADPQLVLFNGASVKIAENDNWGGTAPLTAAFSGVGAFPLPATSKDAALLATLPPGGYTAKVTGVNNSTGTALVEVYEVP